MPSAHIPTMRLAYSALVDAAEMPIVCPDGEDGTVTLKLTV